MALKVAVNGYGTIGKRVADAIHLQKDMTLVGVAKTRPGFEGRRAVEKGFKLFVAGDGTKEEFERAGISVAGNLLDLLQQSDVVIDATPEKVGAANKPVYDEAKIAAVWQGGEKASVAEHSFNALANYPECFGAKKVRVVSCNTTGLARAASVLRRDFGVQHWEATLVRRAADPGETKRGPINGILPTMSLPSHHGPDVRTIFPDLPIATTAVVVPTTLMHVHVNHVRLARPPSDGGKVLEAFRSTPRFVLFRGSDHLEGTPQVIEWARDLGRPRNDVMENVLWEEGLKLDGEDLYFFQAIHQESIVVPENVDVLRAMFQLESDPLKSIERTDHALGIARVAT
ncbi:MAG: type II glyceraldehyde-3-phosphate dehydrogenase [Euryarchaeota archaeon]|nr:type II glyceraldehyde-3-phosphate dehydrogenase [Euryarchaeota archaeon]MDE1837027.1 type II glyceraldehyde-3-phosphate dehydrogenase [Euryarchaeota archaeon]MDE1879877.1 type II glyceraldehyde-3-phosphate dehydrogenase [Euryarchaeota archaeon]MDE2045685.1 type II glyceraldehyde-3-phosphate dehydrogenase [Thermoplasmata archaeon]